MTEVGRKAVVAKCSSPGCGGLPSAMAASPRHDFKIGNAVYLVGGPYRGRHGYIVCGGADQVQVLVKGGPRWPVLVEGADAQIDEGKHRPSSHDVAVSAHRWIDPPPFAPVPSQCTHATARLLRW